MHGLFVAIQSLDVSWLATFHMVTGPVLDWAAWIVSTISWCGACWWLLAAVLWWRGYRRLSVQIAVALVLAALGAEALKHITHRIRPDQIYPQYVHLPLPNLHDSRWSFPSGHAALSAAAAMAAVFATRARFAWVLAGVALLIGFARLYQGVHWPSDVVAGYILGIVAAGFSVSLLAASQPWRRRSQPTSAHVISKV